MPSARVEQYDIAELQLPATPRISFETMKLIIVGATSDLRFEVWNLCKVQAVPASSSIILSLYLSSIWIAFTNRL